MAVRQKGRVRGLLEFTREFRNTIAAVAAGAAALFAMGMTADRWVNVPEVQVQQERSINRLDSLVTVMSAHLVSHSDELAKLRAELDSEWAAVTSLAQSVSRFSIAACMVVEGESELTCRRRMER